MDDRLGSAGRLPSPTLERLSRQPRAAGLEGVADALLSSAPWATMPDAVLVLRYDPFPVLGVLGELDAAQAARVAALFDELTELAPILRVLDHVAVDAAVRRLADHLVSRLGRHRVERASFRAIPRGGVVVLGLLAYALHLDPEQLEPEHDVGGPVVVVDDHLSSGAGVRRWLAAHPPARPVVVAHLLSTVGVRRAIEEDDPRVTACIAGDDLHDLAPERLGPGYAGWRRRWVTRSPEAYWTGLPEPVAFPWAEPDRSVWNPVTEAVEPDWHLVPPDRCSANRPALGLRAHAVQVQVPAPGPIRPADDVVAADLGAGRVIVASADHGDAVRLADVDADRWHALRAAGDVPAAVALLGRWYDAEPARLGSDLEAFVGRMQAAGMLVDERDAEVVQLFGSDAASRRTASATAVTTRSLKTDGTM
jgi:hypothetical protein